MANKETNPKTTTTGKSATAKPAASVKQTAPAAKSSGIAGSAATKQTAAKPAATAPKTSGIAGSAATKQTTAKPAASTAKPAASAKQTAPSKTSGIAGSTATKQTTAKPAASAKQTAPAATDKPTATKNATVINAAPKGTGNSKPAATASTAKPATAPTKPAAKPEAKAVQPALDKTSTQPAAAQMNKPAAAAATTAPKGADKAKTAKQPKQNKTKSAKASGGKGGAVAAIMNNKVRAIAIGAVALVLVVALILGIVLGAKSCNKGGGTGGDINIPLPGDSNSFNQGGLVNPDEDYADRTPGEETFYPELNVDETYNYNTELKTTTQVGFASQKVGEVVRNVPSRTRDQGLAAYPKYGYTLSTVLGTSADKVAMRNALIDESDYLCAYGTSNNSGNGNNGAASYTWMNVDGYLFSGTRAEPVEAVDSNGKHRRLYKHTASVGLYLGDVADDEPGIIKTVTMRPRGYNGYGVTGVYAPAGEVIKITISEADMNATGGLTIHIGQALYNGQSNNIWTAKNQMQRFPNILNTMTLNKNTCKFDEESRTYIGYVGSFLGGPLYIRNTNATFTATISGGVAYPHFILGYTTEKEFEENAKSSAPYFDLEVWNYGVLHSGPKNYAKNFSYEDIYKVAVLWDKVSTVTTTGSSQGIVFLYDPFVAAGAAVAFPGRRSVNCPAGWMSNSLNYNGLVTSGGWGNFHEYHHNFQGYGVGNGGEVTNNGMTLVSYALFTKISAKRGIESYGGQGLGGWNNYTSATWALNDLLSLQRGGHPSNGDQGLTLYSVLLHNFGADNYIKAKVQQQSKSYGQTYAGYFRAWEDITHNDMSYYFKDVLKGLTSEVADKFHNTEYTSMFVPVSSVYQTGRSYMYDGEKKYFKTMQPYVVPYDDNFTLDLSKYEAPNGQYASGSIVIPDGFTYTIKSVTPAQGTVEKIDDYTYKYNFSGNNQLSGEIKVTLSITKDDNEFKVDDVDLILELERSHEANKTQLERTTYTYTSSTMYTDAVEAYNSNFAGYTGEPLNWTHTNPTQNSNTDIWLCTPSSIANFPKADPEKHLAKENTIEVLKGKLYFQEEGKYRIYLRGRVNCAAFLSYTDKNGDAQKATLHVTNGSGSGFYLNNPDTYVDIEVGDNTFVNFTEVLIVKLINGNQASYIGLGYGTWTEPIFTIVEKYYDANDNEVDSPEAEGYHHSKTHYYDYRGNEVSEETANNAQLIAPTSASYVNAYRSNYELPNNSSFESKYFYTREYSYTYSEAHNNLTNQSFVGDHGCFFDENRTDLRPEYLFDGNKTTACSSLNVVSANAPWEFTVDLGKAITANRFVLTGRLNNGAANQNQTPNSITLLVGETLEDMKEVANFDNGNVSGTTLAFNFDTATFRYYKLIVRRTVQGRYAAIANIEFSYNLPAGKQYTLDNDMFKLAGNWEGLQTYSTFGHIYLGSQNSTVEFEFTGTRVGFLSSAAFGIDFIVEIDGLKVDSVELKEIDAYGASYISALLEEGTHKVKLTCKDTSNIDSVVIYP